MEALGMIETRSLTALIEAADIMDKTARVKIAGWQKTGAARVCVLVRGSVADCRAAVDAGAAAAEQLGELIGAHIIANPHEELEVKMPINVKGEKE